VSFGRSTRVVVGVFGLLCAGTQARAELVFLASGRSLSVRATRLEGEQLVLTLRDGGEIVCDRALVTRITPDEVPYPEPVVAPSTVSFAPALPPRELAPAQYRDLIDRTSTRHGVDPQLVTALIHVESGFFPRARSRRGAMGLMQLMPETARRYSLRRPFDPAANVDAGVRHLRSLLDRFPLDLALAAYNAGEAAVDRFQGIPPYPETQDYVSRILQLVGGRVNAQ